MPQMQRRCNSNDGGKGKQVINTTAEIDGTIKNVKMLPWLRKKRELK